MRLLGNSIGRFGAAKRARAVRSKNLHRAASAVVEGLERRQMMSLVTFGWQVSAGGSTILGPLTPNTAVYSATSTLPAPTKALYPNLPNLFDEQKRTTPDIIFAKSGVQFATEGLTPSQVPYQVSSGWSFGLKKGDGTGGPQTADFDPNTPGITPGNGFSSPLGGYSTGGGGNTVSHRVVVNAPMVSIAQASPGASGAVGLIFGWLPDCSMTTNGVDETGQIGIHTDPFQGAKGLSRSPMGVYGITGSQYFSQSIGIAGGSVTSLVGTDRVSSTDRIVHRGTLVYSESAAPNLWGMESTAEYLIIKSKSGKLRIMVENGNSGSFAPNDGDRGSGGAVAATRNGTAGSSTAVYNIANADGSSVELRSPSASVAPGEPNKITLASGEMIVFDYSQTSQTIITSSYTEGGTNYVDTLTKVHSVVGQPTRITLSRVVGGESSSVIREVINTFDTGGRLTSTTVFDGASTSGVVPFSKELYRYDSNSGKMSLRLSSDSYLWAKAALGSLEPEVLPENAVNAALEPFADARYEYELIPGTQSSYRVFKATLQGSGCGCGIGGGGLGQFRYSYETNPSDLLTIGRNGWMNKTMVDLPDKTPDTWLDNDKRVTFSNQWAQPILVMDQNSGGTLKSYTWMRYNDDGQVVLNADSAAVLSYSESLADLVGFNPTTGRATHLSDTNGSISISEYYVSSPADESVGWLKSGSVAVPSKPTLVGKLRAQYVQRGDDKSTQILLSDRTYTDGAVADDGLFYLASQTKYVDELGAQPLTTSYSYTFHSTNPNSSLSRAIASRTVTEPKVTGAQNGPDSAGGSSSFASAEYYDLNGRVIWSKNADGFVNYFEYDRATGALTKSIVDVDQATLTSAADPKPTRGTGSPGEVLPTALNLTTLREVDAKGRVTKQVEAAGGGSGVEQVSYTFYDDTAFDADGSRSVRQYSGWDPVLNRPTGPVRVTRTVPVLLEAAGSPAIWTGLKEVVTYVWVAAQGLIPSGWRNGTSPTGAEGLNETGLQIASLEREYTNISHQTTRGDAYVSLPSSGYSTAFGIGVNGVNFHRTEYKYTGRAEKMSTVSPTGTVSRFVYDGLNRIAESWVGTNDAGATASDPTGGGASGNNMRRVMVYAYDDVGGIAGNGNVVGETTILDSGAAPQRVRIKANAFDWRNRLVSTKVTDTTSVSSESSDGQRMLSTFEYDNLGRTIASRVYDGDKLSLTNNAAAFQSVNALRMRSYSTSEYDDQDRMFRSKTFAVDPTDGSFSTSTYLANLTWFDRRGNVIKSAGPNGPVSKRVYDGAGRVTKSYVTDGGGDAAAGAAGSWTDAGSVTGDAVLEQVEQGYDAASQVITTTRRQRFHDETGTGELGTAASGVKARVSYAGMYYDLAGRAVASVDVGTNGGTAWTRPTTAPTSSTSTLLLSTYTYDVLDSVTGFFGTEATDARSVKSRSFADLRGQTVRTIEAYTNGTPTADSNRITTYTYDGSGHILTMKAYTTGSSFQETKYVYGISPANSSKIFSNDVLSRIQYPNPSDGTASNAFEEKFAYDGSGARIIFTDRIGNVHDYTYDPVGRLTSDGVGGFEGVRKLTYSYDSAGRLASASSLSGTGAVLNTVTRTYNGFGSIVSEVQPGGTVTYAYSTPSATSNHSRLTSMTYGSRTVNYVYDSGLDSTISRISRLQDVALATSGGQVTLEGYQYLGLSTPVARTRPEAGGGLQLYKKSNEANGDAGDKYTGLDRFGRVRDQRWLDGSGNDADRFRYGYDTAGNPLFKENVVAPARSELYHAAGTNAESTGYDPLNRIKAFSRGTLSFTGSMATGITGTPIVSKNWSLDALGNWSQVTIGSNTATRTHDSQNRLTNMGSGPALIYDANGNQKTNERGEALTYDLWNRLVRVGNGSTLYSSYTYDALSRRISITTDTGGGKLDPTFGGGTGSVTNVATGDDRGHAVAIQSDGKAVVVGYENGQVLVLRYKIDGTLDNTFNPNGPTPGKLVVNLGGGTSSSANAVAIDSTGRILIAGRSNGSGFVDAFVTRLNSNGAADTSFGTGGTISFDIAGSGFEDVAQKLAIRSDGKVLVLSSVREVSSNRQSVAVTQLTSAGLIDSTNWATSTAGHFRWGYDYQWGRGIALLSDGNLIVTGHQSTSSSTPFNGFALRVLTNGTLDASFGTSGVASFGTSEDDQFDGGVVINDKGTTSTTDDNIIIAGSVGQNIYTGPRRALIAQLTASGTVDTAFSGDGIAEFPVQYSSRADTISLQSDGRILIGGKILQSVSSSPDAAVLRVNDNGTLDATFGVGGVTTYNLGFDDFANGSGVFSASRLVITGAAVNNGHTTFNTTTLALTLGGQATTNLTYSAQWQVLVETPVVSLGGSFTETTRVWSPLYVDGLVGSDERFATVLDEGFDENGYFATYGYSLTARSYVRADANWNVTSLVRAGAGASPVWATVERYEYDPYGSVTYLSGSFGVLTAGSYGQKYLHQGGRLDEVTGLYSFRFREYDPVQGRWKQADPAGYADSKNLYEMVRSSPIDNLDPAGLGVMTDGLTMIISSPSYQLRRVQVIQKLQKITEELAATIISIIGCATNNGHIARGASGAFDGAVESGGMSLGFDIYHQLTIGSYQVKWSATGNGDWSSNKGFLALMMTWKISYSCTDHWHLHTPGWDPIFVTSVWKWNENIGTMATASVPCCEP